MEAKALDSTTFQYGHLPAVISLLLPNLFPSFVSELQNYTTKQYKHKVYFNSATKWPLYKTRRPTNELIIWLREPT